MSFNICEIFPSIQGEGVNTGLPTVFVRFFGCNLSCSWCDTEYSKTGSQQSSMDLRGLLEKVSTHYLPNVCLTGGEPLLQEGVIELVEELILEGFNVDMETNGSLPVIELVNKCPAVRISMDVKTPSSGMSDSFLDENLDHLRFDDTLKFIIASDEDLSFALEFVQKHDPGCNIILTPCTNKGGDGLVEGLLKAIRSCEGKDENRHGSPFSRARVMVQTHRVIWGDRKGV